jgi:hypothetical protein
LIAGSGLLPGQRKESVMAVQKFNVGQKVEFLPGSLDGNVPRGTYTITRVLPVEAGGRNYRVKNVRDGHERVVRESQLGPG